MFSYSPFIFSGSVSVFGRWIIFISFMFLTSFAIAGSAIDLKEKYDEIEDRMLDSAYGIPVHLESDRGKNFMRGDVYSIIYHPFNKVSKTLSSLTNWCEIMPQHLNIKACTYEYVANNCKLTFYSGRKVYKKADNAYRLNYNFNVNVLNDEYFNATLDAQKGPLYTKDYYINVEAIPLTDSSTFFHLRYEYKFGFMARIAMTTYLTTIGRNKVGFTIKEMDKHNKPVYIGGIRGVIERNAIRYYFAIQSYLDTQTVAKNKRFEKRIGHWFDLTEEYRQQLHELDKNDYLKYKRMERQDQLRLQRVILEKTKTAKAISTTGTTCISME